jgi:hypothetical protein
MDRRATAYHEAAHAIAAALCAVQWYTARIFDDDPDLDGRVTHEPIRDPESRAFIAWAGAYGEARARYPRDDPFLRERVHEARAAHGFSDEMIMNCYDHTPADHARWAAALERAWPEVRKLAVELLRDGMVATPYGEDLESVI